MRFPNGFVAESVYGKGEVFGQSENFFTIYIKEITLVFNPEYGQLLQGENRRNIKVGTRRSLFALDTDIVLKYLLNCRLFYVISAYNLYFLKFADSAMRAKIGKM
jgi:biliverdin reductase